MMNRNQKLALLGMALAPLIGLGLGCESKGPAERAGENLDRSVENARDALDPRGPGEKAGEALDRAADKAVHDAGDAAHDAGDALDRAADKVDRSVNP